ncbi:MAG TPA: two-component system regulatory protein YycI [Anaerovoracaceae bacterium]|nr:two-component system regulatory protein YycI [Anaerovoracaceae bacterium]
MDWTKAKTILIVALVVTNLVLIATYFTQNNRFENDEKKMEDVTIKLLEEKNIFVETDIPEERPRMARLTVQFDTMDEDVVNEQLAKQKPLPAEEQTDENLVARAEDFIEKCGLMTENVTFSHIARTGSGTQSETAVFFKNYINGIAIEDSHIICTIEDGRITGFDRYWLNPVEVNNMEREVTPAVAALVRFMSETTGEEKIHVEDITLVYWLDSSVFDAESPVIDTAFPAWRITYNQGDDRINTKVAHIMAWEQ